VVFGLVWVENWVGQLVWSSRDKQINYNDVERDAARSGECVCRQGMRVTC